jgi:UDP-N-acetylglucosamine--N-acetylmuramyl-(pentapeptide) pyrophosphoryl-undecaprenol N-acetylglucosamine transferase
MNNTIVISTGGTGGHIFPALAVAKNLNNLGFKVIIFGDKNYPKYHPKQSFCKFKVISSSQIKKSPFALVIAGLKISFGIIQSLFLLLIKQPKAIVAFGGYATFPVLVAAIILKKKIILHEQNAHLGKVNRIFAKFADKIALSYEETSGTNLNTTFAIPSKAKDLGQKEEILRYTQDDKIANDDRVVNNDKKNDKFIFTGNPIRDEIVALSKNEYQLPDFNQQIIQPDNLGYDVLLASEFHNQKYQNNKPYFNILVLGGSGGAKIFSEILPKAFFNLRSEIKNNLMITMQCRAENLQYTFEQYKSFNINIIINSFFTDIDKQIQKSHLVIARSGSSTLAELTCAKKPMILIPFAQAADNHQEKNALAIERSGGAIVIKEENFTINNISSTVERLIDNPALLYKMSSESFKCANLQATENLTKLIIRLI